MEPGQFQGFPFGGMGGPPGGSQPQGGGGGGGMPPGFPGMMGGGMGCGGAGGGGDAGGMARGGMGGGMPGMGGMGGMGGMAGMAAAMGMGGMGGKGGMGGFPGMAPGMGNLQGMAGMQNFFAAMQGMQGMQGMGGGPQGGMPGMPGMMGMFPDQDGSRSSGAGLLRGRDDRDEGGGGGGGGNDELSNEVRDFVDKWSLEQRFETRLIEQLRKRGSSWQEDLSSLGRTLQDARSPPALLSVKLREMEEGTFEPGGRGGFGGGGGGGGGGGESVGMCYDFKQGICDRGDRCRFSHGDAGGGGKGKGGGKGFGKGGDAPEWMMDDIRDLCDKYNLDDRLQRRLADAMKSREKSFKEDMRSLGEVLATARNPPGLLSVKLREMEDGTFVAKGGSKGGDRFGGDRFGGGDRGDRGYGGGGGGHGGEHKIMSKDRKRELFGSLSPVRKRSRSTKRRNRSDSRPRRRRSSRSPSAKRRSRARSEKRDSRSRSKKKGRDRDREKDRGDDREYKKAEKDRGEDREYKKAEKDRGEDREYRKAEKDRGDDREYRKAEKERQRGREREKEFEREEAEVPVKIDKLQKEQSWEQDCARSRSRDRSPEQSPDRSRGSPDVFRERTRESPDVVREKKKDYMPQGGVEIAPPGGGVQIAPPAAMDDEEVHYGVACGRCYMNPIRGDRFKCSVCDSYDLCEACYELKAQVHPGNHRFFVQKAVKAQPPKPEERQPAAPPFPGVGPPQQQPAVQTPEAMAAEQLRQLQMLFAAQLAASGQQAPPQMAMPAPMQMAPPAQMPSALPQQQQQTAPAAPQPAAPPQQAAAAPPMGLPPQLAMTLRPQAPPPVQQAPAPQAAQPPAQQPEPAVEKEAPPAAAVRQEPVVQPEGKKAKQSGPAWLPPDLACGLCNQAAESSEPHGVICRRRRKNGSFTGCGQGVCWACMETRPRSELGMVRTTREELESLDQGAWWMHERCMEQADLRAYYGGEKELALARAAADQEEAGAQAKASGSGAKGSQAVVGDPVEVVKEQIRKLSVKELKQYLDRHQVDHTQCLEKKEMLAKALEVAAFAPQEPAKGPAWMTVGAPCRLCTKPVNKDCAGVVCRRVRSDGSVGGCGEGICWRCMKRAPRESFGNVRCTKEEFESLEEDAWWMHEACFEEGDYKDYFNESEPEDVKSRREGFAQDRSQAEPRSSIGSIMRRCESR